MIDFIDQDIFGSVAEQLQPKVSNIFKSAGEPGQRLKNFLNGVWLGHPLHPILKDIPVGAWTTALLFDALRMDRAADVAILFGLAGATGSAVTGLVDWSDTYGRAQRLGIGHAAFNITSTLFYAASSAIRPMNRPVGKALSLVGYAMMAVGAYIGGHLVFAEQIGVNHAAAQELPHDFVAVLPDAELIEGEKKRVDAKGVPVLLVRRDAKIFALLETCSHLGGPLAEGTLKDGSVICPWHASRFSLDDGKVLDGPATQPQPRFETRVVNGQIEVRATG